MIPRLCRSCRQKLPKRPRLAYKQVQAPVTPTLPHRHFHEIPSLRQQDVHHRDEHSPPIPTYRGDDRHSNIAPAETIGSCPGCGALAQTVQPNEAGYYSLTRKTLKTFLGLDNADAQQKEDSIYAQALSQLENRSEQLTSPALSPTQDTTPLCNRCHDLIHHSTGTPIIHPSLSSIEEIIASSPYKYNHVYHVLDAVDFPMSLIPAIPRRLSLHIRSRNRRSQSKHFHGRKTELSFVITRADLLAPTKDALDRMMPYFLEVLRESLGRRGQDVRLGNVVCLSAKRGWWTKKLKEDIWTRGQGGWMVGKANVGKSNLFEAVFPKGRTDGNVSVAGERQRQQRKHDLANLNDPDSLLPPSRPETAYPTMPTISSLPGTTASPIRVPFGSGRGELIDLPGLSRSRIDTFVVPDRRDELVMKTRVMPEQYSLKRGQSLLLGGGLVRITPRMPEGMEDTVLLAYPFTPLDVHITSDEKFEDAVLRAKAAAHTDTPQHTPRPSESETSEGTKSTEQSAESPTLPVSPDTKSPFPNSLLAAGAFSTLSPTKDPSSPIPLSYDVTRQRTGPLTSKSAARLKPAQLPFTVQSIDILVESVGWIELVAQVRKPPAVESEEREFDGGDQEDEDATTMMMMKKMPAVEVWTPNGKFVATRRPLGAWIAGGGKEAVRKSKGGSRPWRNVSARRRIDGGRHGD